MAAAPIQDAEPFFRPARFITMDISKQRGDQYRHYAAHAKWLAQHAHDVEAKLLFEQTARYWAVRAEQERLHH